MDFGLCTRLSDDPSKWIYQNLVNPTRLPNDDFSVIRSLSGEAVVRGTNQPAINDSRIYGKFHLKLFNSWSTFRTYYFLNSNFFRQN